MKYKSATVIANIYDVMYVDIATKEVKNMSIEGDEDMKPAELDKYLTSKLPVNCVKVQAVVTGKKEIIYRIPWTVFLANAEVWKIDGQTVNKSEGQ